VGLDGVANGLPRPEINAGEYSDENQGDRDQTVKEASFSTGRLFFVGHSKSLRKRSRACCEVRNLKVSRSYWLSICLTSVFSGVAKPIKTVPAGFSGVPPVGPAMPVTERA